MGKSVWRTALGDDYDAAILDIMLPSLDGLGVLHELRRQKSALPVLDPQREGHRRRPRGRTPERR